jgi:tetratricopeptide (TPR) repeat protein
MSTPTVHVFVSSTWLDLQPERDAVEVALQRMRETKLIGMEYFGSRDDTTRTVSLEEVDRSHYYIGIFGARYGSGITEDEYRRARSNNIPCRIYFKADRTIDAAYRETDATKVAKLTALKTELKRDHTIPEFTSPDDLAARITADFHNWLVEQKHHEHLSDSRLHQLPPNPRTTGFVGRDTDLATLRAMPGSGTVITGLRGMGGIGKTALGLVLAHEWMPQFPDAQLFLEGFGTSERSPSGSDLQSKVIHAFHPTAKLPDDDHAIAQLYAQVLSDKKALIFLDNAKDAAQAKPLIPPAGCALIVTTRQSILLGTRKPHDVGRLPAADAAKLLREYHPALTDAHATELHRLCAGMPLARRLAGAHLALEGDRPNVAAYIKELSSGRLAALDAEAADTGEISVSETLRLSEAMLTEEQRQAWRALGVFSGSFDERAAAAIIIAQRRPISFLGKLKGLFRKLPQTDMRHTLDLLTRRSLLERAEGDRYQLHDLAADYARARLGPSALDSLRQAHGQHYPAIGREADSLYTKGKPVEGLALFDAEREQIEAAYGWLTKVVAGFSPSNLGQDEDHRADGAVRAKAQDDFARQLIALVDAVCYTSDLRFHPRQRIDWSESQLHAARQLGDRAAEGRALGYLGLAHAALGDARKAIAFYEQQLVITREIGDRRGEGAALGNLGNAHANLGDARQAMAFYEQQLDIARKIGDRRGEGNALGNLGIAHKNLGDARKAIEFYEQSLVISREIGNRRGEGADLGDLGNAHAALGDSRKAIGFYEQQLVIVREIGDQRGEGNALSNSAYAFEKLGDRSEALRRARAALAIFEAIEDPWAAELRAAIAKWEAVA